MRTHGKFDLNQRAIVKVIRQWPGATVVSSANLGAGFSDLILGYRGRTILLEVKGPKGKLTPQQIAFHAAWTGSPVVILRSEAEAITLMSNLDAAHRYGIVPASLPHTER